MLSEEEKKAIETIKDFKNLKWYEHAFDNGTEVLDEEQKQDLEIVLNLIEKQNKIIDNAINEVEKVRQYYDDGLQPEFIGILEILKDKKVIDW